MRVQIVCAEHDSDQILARLARTLAEGTGWSLGITPDPTADANLFFPYLIWDGRWRETPLVGEFSHRDTSIRGKTHLWDRAAQVMDLRLTWAEQYRAILDTCGPTATVTMPLDRARFRPGPPREPRKRPRVGVSGMVYRGGRKGEDLVAALAASPFGKRIELVGSGTGWPVPTKRHTWDDVPAWYRTLDVLLCTSTVEGVPYPPLEALATGCKVVIPLGVGLLDELGDAPGLWRYPAGDGDEMVRALHLALDSPADPDALRALTERFTAEAWCADHERAIGALLGVESEAPVEADAGGSAFSITVEAEKMEHPEVFPAWRGNAGVYVVAYGAPARKCAVRNLASLKRHMPSLPACLVSDAPLKKGETIFVAAPDADLGARSVKTRMYDLAPSEWTYVAYLDADTELVGPIDALFGPLVDGWDLVICPNPARYGLVRDGMRPDNADETAATAALLGHDELLQWNGGVLAFRRSPQTAAFFAAWHAAWQEHGKRDQFALLRALWAHPLRVWVLGRDFNATDRYDEWRETTAIKHYPLQARRWRGLVRGRLDSSEAWAAYHPGPTPERSLT